MDQLRQSLGLLQVAFDAASEAMLILDGDLLIRWANKLAADQWAGGLAIQMVGKSLASVVDFYHPETGLVSVDDGRHPVRRMVVADGQDRMIVQSAGSGMDATAQLIPQQISWRSIPQLKQPFWLLRVRNLEAEEQALLQQQFFMNQLAHELRTPLAIVIGSLQRLEKLGDLTPSCSRQLQIAREEAKRINRLLIQLTLLSELDTGRFAWRWHTSTPLEWIHHWLSGVDPQLQPRLIVDLSALAGEAGVLVRLDQRALNLILGNLFDNSRRYSPDQSPIFLSAAVRDGVLQLCWRDQGPGLPEAARAHIFERFNRLERTRDPSRSDGAGLGLAVVKALVEAMDGQVALLPPPSADSAVYSGLGIQICFPVRTA